MKEKFLLYNLELQEVLIGTPTSGAPGGQIEQILIQLRSRQIANEQVETYERQQSAAVKERELREAEAKARQQTLLTESAISIEVQSNQGKADFAKAQQQAAQIQTLAGAEAEKVRLMGVGEAKRIMVMAEAQAEQAARVGIAQALAIEEQVRAYGGPQFQLVQQVMNRFAEAIEKSQVDVVPKISMAGGGQGGGNLIENLLGVLLSEKVGEIVGIAPTAPPHPLAEQMRSEMRDKLTHGPKQQGPRGISDARARDTTPMWQAYLPARLRPRGVKPFLPGISATTSRMPTSWPGWSCRGASGPRPAACGPMNWRASHSPRSGTTA